MDIDSQLFMHDLCPKNYKIVKKEDKMKRNLLLRLFPVVCLFISFVACDKDEKYDGPSPEQVNARYSNKLSMGGDTTLTLTYSGQVLIGKDVYFKMKDPGNADITLLGILPGEKETSINNVTLLAKSDSYSFSGNSTGTNGTTFHYEGSVKEGKMIMNLTDVEITGNQLTTQGEWYIVHNKAPEIEQDADGINKYTYHNTTYNGVGGPGGNSSTLIGLVYGFVINKIFGNAVSSVLDGVTFNPDGNITSAYAPLPDSMTISKLISGYGVMGRPSTDWKASPLNLATYYVKNDSDLYVTPNIDMIIRQAELNKTKSETGDSTDVGDALEQIYKKLNAWSTTGVKLVIRKNDKKEYQPVDNGKSYERYAGDVILVLKKEEIQDFFLLFDVALAVIPADTLDKSLKELLQDVVPAEYMVLIELLLKGETLKSILIKIRDNVNAIPIEVGLYLSKEQTFN